MHPALSDPDFLAAARALSPDALRAELRHIAAGIAAAAYRHSPDGSPLPDIETLTDELFDQYRQSSTQG